MSSVGFVASGKSFRCTATLIGKRTVLTAAHCVSSDVPAINAAYFDVNGTWTGYNVTATATHPNYDADQKINDLALVRLLETPPVQATPVSTAVPQDGWKVKLYGAGYTGDNANDPGVMRIADNTVGAVGKLRLAFYGNTGAVGNLCFGDSGGPTFTVLNGKPAQIGVHSFIKKDCATGEGYDVRLDPFVPWLESTSAGDVLVADGIAPTVTIDSPFADATIIGDVKIVASAKDERALAKIEVHVDNKLVGEAQAAKVEVTASLEPGRHAVRVTAYDAGGNTATAQIPITVEAPAEPPPPPEPQTTAKPIDPVPSDPQPITPPATPDDTPRLLEGGCAVASRAVAGHDVAATPPTLLVLLSLLLACALVGRRRRRPR
ncbi:MAG: trypsin-like serine protease [Myxococcales bacterium]|nr:trypsin-like serine protease [Myxococcales bacterium]